MFEKNCSIHGWLNRFSMDRNDELHKDDNEQRHIQVEPVVTVTPPYRNSLDHRTLKFFTFVKNYSSTTKLHESPLDLITG